MDMIDLINDEFGTSYDDDAPWTEVLAPGTLPHSPRGADGGALGGGGCWGAGCWWLYLFVLSFPSACSFAALSQLAV